MGIFDLLKREDRAVTVAPELMRAGAGILAASGIAVTPALALNVGAVFASVRVLAETVATLSIDMIERLDNGDKRIAHDHYLQSLIHDMPNEEMSAFDLWETAIGHTALRGNGYIHLVRDGRGRVIELWPIVPDYIQPQRSAAGDLTYLYMNPHSGETRRLQRWEIMHLHGLGYDGLQGYGVVKLAKDTFGLALAHERFASGFYANGAAVSGVLTYDDELSEKSIERLRKNFKQEHSGLQNAYKVMILEYGIGYQAIGVKPDEAQFLQSREFQIPEIARWFRVPPHMIGHLANATFSNIEQQSIEFLRDTIAPWARRIEQSIYRSLLLPEDRGRFAARVNTNAILRGDTAARTAYYNALIDRGVLSPNEVRAMEGMNRIEGGDRYYMPLNMIAVDQLDQMSSDQRARLALGPGGFRADLLPSPDAGRIEARLNEAATMIEARANGIATIRQRTIAAQLPILIDVLARILRRESNDIENAAGRELGAGAGGFAAWLDRFYEDLRPAMLAYLLPVLHSFAATIGAGAAEEIGGAPPDLEAFADAYARAYIERHIGRSRSELDTAIEDEDTDQALGEMFTRWRETRAETVAGGEGIRLGNAAARAAYLAAGVKFLRWVTAGDTCPYCRRLNGAIIGIESFFVIGGVAFEPDGDGDPLRVKNSIGHPPLHKGCDCHIVASRER